MVIKAVRQTDENAAGKHASENTATKMDETDRETSETDENWQTVTNQRSNKLQKTIPMHQRLLRVSLDRRSLRI